MPSQAITETHLFYFTTTYLVWHNLNCRLLEADTICFLKACFWFLLITVVAFQASLEPDRRSLRRLEVRRSLRILPNIVSILLQQFFCFDCVVFLVFLDLRRVIFHKKIYILWSVISYLLPLCFASPRLTCRSQFTVFVFIYLQCIYNRKSLFFTILK